MFVYGDVVYAQTWEVLTVKNCIEPPLIELILAIDLQKDFFAVVSSLFFI